MSQSALFDQTLDRLSRLSSIGLQAAEIQAVMRMERRITSDIFRQKIINVRNKSVYRIELFNVEEAADGQAVDPTPVDYSGNYVTVINMINRLVEVASRMPVEEQQTVAINLSNTVLVDPDLLGILLHRLEDLPYGLSIEVTQLGELPEPRTLNGIFSALRQLNCSIEFDDFGGPNSKNPQVLSEYSFDSMKLNAAFVRSMLDDDRRLRMLGLIAGMVKAQGKQVIGTGVSSQLESDKLDRIGIFLQQGDHTHPLEPVV